jgi:hypothetical protein
MQLNGFPRWICIVMAIATGALGRAPVGQTADVIWGHMKADKILFLGNSITLHGPKADIAWSANWGMAASQQSKDYVHLLTSAIDTRTGGKLVLEPTPVGSHAGTENVINIADIFERNYSTFTTARIQKQLDWKPDIVVLQFGENMEMKSYNAEVFQAKLETLLSGLKQSSNPHIFVAGFILGSNPKVDAIKRKACKADPGRRVFVDLGSVAKDPTNFASAESYYKGAVVGHPGNKGMTLIANTLCAAMAAHAAAGEAGCR